MRTLLSLSLAWLALGAPAWAQAPPCNCPMNCQMGGAHGPQGGPYARMFDPKTVESFRGEIVSIERPMGGIHAVVKTDKGNVTVHLGPAWYLDNQETQLAAGDRVQVKGSRVAIGGQPAVIAAEVKKGNETLTLRDDKGFPAWRGWR